MLLPGAEILNSIVRKTPRAEFLEKQFLHLEYNDSVGGGGGFPRTSLPPGALSSCGGTPHKGMKE